MELLLTAAALVLWQSWVYVPDGAAALVRFARRWLVLEGPGVRLLSPTPGSVSLVLAGWPLVVTPRSVFVSGPVSRLDRGAGGAERALAWQSLRSATARGSLVVAEGVRFARAASPLHASRLASWLRETAAAPEAERTRLAAAALRDALRLDAFRARFERTMQATRRLRWLSRAYGLLVFAVVPPVIFVFGGEHGWRLAVPAIATAHVLSLLAWVQAERRLGTPRAGRGERILAAALYPPALLRGASELVGQELTAFHALTAEAALLPRERFAERLRRTIAQVRLPPWQRHGGHDVPEQTEREAFLRAVEDALLGLGKQAGLARDELTAPRLGAEPLDIRYCPLCCDDFRPGFDRCRGCGVATVAYQK